MTVTDAQIQGLLILEVGDMADNRLALNVAVIWDRYADKALIYPRLREFYVKRALIDLCLGGVRNNVSFSEPGGLSIQQNLQTTNLRAMKVECEAEIRRLEELARKNRPIAVGTLTNVEPRTPPPFPQPLNPRDANDPLYTGDPYLPSVVRT